MNVLQCCDEVLLAPWGEDGGGQYDRTVRGEPKIRSFPPHPPAPRSSPQVGFSPTLRTINWRIFPGSRGLPTRHFPFQNRLNPLPCQPIRVSGLTITNASFQSNSRDQKTRENRAERVSRRGPTCS